MAPTIQRRDTGFDPVDPTFIGLSCMLRLPFACRLRVYHGWDQGRSPVAGKPDQVPVIRSDKRRKNRQNCRVHERFSAFAKPQNPKGWCRAEK
jgi:hypothetical protein